jgi:hypothetical protein
VPLIGPDDDDDQQSFSDDGFTPPPDEPEPDGTPDRPHKLIYHERGHAYWLNGKRAKGVSTVAKIAADDYKIRMWNERMVALGVTIDGNLRENVAMHAEDIDALANICEEAKRAAKAHLKADRGSQKHRVLELILTGQEHKLITDQQRQDAEILKRTMERYALTPRTDLAEQFVIYPAYGVCGRFDAVLMFETNDGRTVLVDLKSGENAVKYPHSTDSQLAMYARAPHISTGAHRGDRIEITEWSTMPADLDLDTGYVLLVTNDQRVGTLHRLDIAHGWRAAEHSLELINWRKEYENGRGIVAEVTDVIGDQIRDAITVDQLREIWTRAAQWGILTDELKGAITTRKTELETVESQAS